MERRRTRLCPWIYFGLSCTGNSGCPFRHTASEDEQTRGALGRRRQLREGPVRPIGAPRISGGRQVDHNWDVEEEIYPSWDGRLYPDNNNG